MCLLITVLMDPVLIGLLEITTPVSEIVLLTILFSFLIFNILETIAFSATWTSYAPINKGTVLRFNNVQT